MTTSIYGNLVPKDVSHEQKIVQSLKDYNRVIFKITGLVLISVSCVSCAISLTLVIYLDDKTNRLRQVFGYTYSVLLFILNLLSVFALIHRKIKLIYPTMLANLIIAVVVALSMFMLQISQDIQKKNGTGKVPLIDPHTYLWYQIDSAFTILTYVIAAIVIVQEIIVYLYVRPTRKQDKVKPSFYENDKDKFYLQTNYNIQIKEEKYKQMPDIPEIPDIIPQEQIISREIEQNENISNSLSQVIFENTLPNRKQKAIDILRNQSGASFSINDDRNLNQSLIQQFAQNQ